MLRCSALLLLSILSLAGPCRAAASTVILVRHAEKADAPAADPALSPAGTARADQLAMALADAGVSRIIVSRFRRTRDTATPLATKLGIAPTVVEVGADIAAHVEAVVSAIRAAEGTVLVVGHSNTVPAIVTALGGPALPPLCENHFGQVFVVQATDGEARLQRWRYGAADLSLPPDCP